MKAPGVGCDGTPRTGFRAGADKLNTNREEWGQRYWQYFWQCLRSRPGLSDYAQRQRHERKVAEAAFLYSLNVVALMASSFRSGSLASAFDGDVIALPELLRKT